MPAPNLPQYSQQEKFPSLSQQLPADAAEVCCKGSNLNKALCTTTH
jgi:hypothetical protein